MFGKSSPHTVYAMTRAEIVDTFRRWNADVPKNLDGTLKGPTPNNPEETADIFLSYAKKA